MPMSQVASKPSYIGSQAFLRPRRACTLGLRIVCGAARRIRGAERGPLRASLYFGRGCCALRRRAGRRAAGRSGALPGIKILFSIGQWSQ